MKPWALLTSDEKIQRLSSMGAFFYWWLVFLSAVVAVLVVRTFA